MRVLIVCSTKSGTITPFVKEQVESCEQFDNFQFNYAEIKSGGISGYIKGYFSFLKQLPTGNYNLVHAHYGLSAFIACLQPFKKVVITFHGCDVNDPKTRWISKIAHKLCKHAIFVEAEMPAKLNAKNKFSIIPCGVNTELFKPMDKIEARKKLNFLETDKIVLFASAFDVPVKNYVLAKAACDQIPELKLIELKNYSREEVCLLLNACDVLLLTSIREGSPQIIKEALACNCPIVTTNVGDVAMRLKGINQSFVCDADANQISDKIIQVLSNNKRSNGRERIFEQQLDLDSVAKQINKIYLSILY
ncbi:MAG: glycosyltransferase [Bacteroidota bacterium]|nr:glycosyltransferase [Bacteroidota bacterium]MDP3144341.1 glycosyltransferase [Bacteroidota bacterium]